MANNGLRCDRCGSAVEIPAKVSVVGPYGPYGEKLSLCVVCVAALRIWLKPRA